MPADEVNLNGAGWCPRNMRDPYQAVREAVPLHEVAGRYIELHEVDNKYLGCCPLHVDSGESVGFSCDPDRRWRCSQCCQEGDVIDLAFHLGDYGERWEAMVALAVDYGVDIPEDPRSWFGPQERHDG